MLDAGRAVRNFREVVLAQLFLFLHAEGTMVGGDDLQIIHLQTFFQLSLVCFLAQRRSHYVLRTVEIFAIIIDRKKEILRAGFRESRKDRKSVVEGKKVGMGWRHDMRRQ